VGKGKDIKLVKELIFGDDIQKFEKRFNKINNKLESIENIHKEQFKVLNHTLREIDETQKKLRQMIDSRTSELHVSIIHHQNRLKTHIEETDTQIEKMKKSTSENLNILKSEMMMLIESKLNSMDKIKISHEQMADIFSSLAKELTPTQKEKKHHI
jgi:F0F1-type ATP synthase membrane subunit b/b'